MHARLRICIAIYGLPSVRLVESRGVGCALEDGHPQLQREQHGLLEEIVDDRVSSDVQDGARRVPPIRSSADFAR